MRYGTVVQYFPSKGFGFIRPDTGPDVFFHVTALGACQQPPEIQAGQPVKFELMSKAEAKLQSRPETGEAGAKEQRAERPRAKLVELIDKIPGGILEEGDKPPAAHHPRARQKKPSWRR